jgi:hypothetical protein
MDFEKRILKLEGELRETKNRKTLCFTRFSAKYFTLVFLHSFFARIFEKAQTAFGSRYYEVFAQADFEVDFAKGKEKVKLGKCLMVW